MEVYIVMGVAGVGKTTIGKLLAEKKNLPFYDADDFHSSENVSKMQKGEALEDRDREQWLENLARKIQEWHRTTGGVLACSALKKAYREKLASIPEKDLNWIFLHSEYEVIQQRIAARRGHYFNPQLLRSQFNNLEIPARAIHINVEKTKEEIVAEIMEKLKEKEEKSQVGLVGLGVMGKSLALNLASKGVKTAVYNRQVENKEVDIARQFALEYPEKFSSRWFDNLETFVTSLQRPRKVILMVSAGKAVDMIIEEILPFLENGDVLIDGGNSHYQDSIRREQILRDKGCYFIGAGISGGQEGARKGPSIMPGGNLKAYEQVSPFLETIAARDRHGEPCCSYIGPGGSGHFVKMVHNGIEYGEMQIIAETYFALRFQFGKSPEAIAQLFSQWNKKMNSFLLEISIDILQKRDEDQELLLDKVLDAAKQKGTGGWSTIAALELGVSLDTITAAVMARNISAKKEQREQAAETYRMRKDRSASREETSTQDIYAAFEAASIINHSIGFDLMAAASKEFHWNLNLSEIARVWTNGCIIRSSLMEEISQLYRQTSDHLLLHSSISQKLQPQHEKLQKVCCLGLEGANPMPVMSAALNYLLSFTSAQTSANLIQAQRDYFGAHTYERIDRPRGSFFHSNWKEDF